jgi:hypothetical protein
MPAPQVRSTSAESGRHSKTFLAPNCGPLRRGRRGGAMGIWERRVVAVEGRDPRLMRSRMILAPGAFGSFAHDWRHNDIFRGQRVWDKLQAGRRPSSVDAGERATARRNCVERTTKRRRS